MSVIAGKVYDDKIIVAADSIIVRGWDLKRTGFSKLAYINEMIVGGSGTAAELSLFFQYMHTHRPASPTESDVLAFVVEFASWKKDYNEDAVSNMYLLAFKGHLFSIEGTFVNEVKDFEAVGAGEDFALAALYLGHTPEEAVKVSCDLSCYVAEPIMKFEMPREEAK